MTVRRKHISRLARNILLENRIEAAPVDVFQIAMKMGLEVREQKADDDLSGFLYRGQAGNPTWIGINSAHSSQRQRFTIAHEIGHFVLHPTERVHVDKGYEIKRRDNKSKEGTDIEEIESNLFAAELLMPADFLIRDLSQMESIDLSDDNALKELAKRYQVSAQALAVRLAALGFVQ